MTAISTIPATLTKIIATRPARLSKLFTLDDGGALAKAPGGQLVEGVAECLAVEDLVAFGALLESLTPDTALVYGTPKSGGGRVMSHDEWNKAGRPADAHARTMEAYCWPAGPGIMFLDYDAPMDAPALDRDTLVARLRSALPGLADASLIWWPSGSSCLHRTADGAELSGIGGQRFYMFVADARDIERAGAALVNRLWLAGLGRVVVSSSGAMLLRTLVDASVWQSNRLDFAAGAACGPGVEQRRGTPVLLPGAIKMVDTRTALPDLTAAEMAQVKTNQLAARREAKPAADERRAAWIDARVAEVLSTHPDADADAVAATIRRAVESNTLAGDFNLTLVDGDVRVAVPVLDILDNPAKYHGCLTLDPLEPEYDGGRPVGKVYLYSSRPRLFSFAHGGRAFKLVRQPERIELVTGRTHDAVIATLAIMRAAPDVFDFGATLATVDGGRIRPLDEPGLAFWLGGATQYWRWKTVPNVGPVELLCDPPAAVGRQILALGETRALKRLDAVITAPTIRRDGSLLTAPGYDEHTRLLLDGDDFPTIPLEPTHDQAAAALDALLRPFRDFPFVADVDRGVLLSALLTAAVRPILPTSPAFGFDAPVQASGKTLLAFCVSVLATGAVPTVFPPVSAKDDDEIRKRVFSALREGDRVLLLDNLIGSFDSPALAAALTSSTFSDRVLGQSLNSTVPNRAMVLLTGNNLQCSGDMARRVLPIRIDPGTDKPFAREFALDPLNYVTEHRHDMIAAALTLVRAMMTGQHHRARGRLASFEVWDDIVRQTVVWVSEDMAYGADPMRAVLASQGADPEQEALASLLTALDAIFGANQFTARQVVDVCAEAERYPSFSSEHVRDLRDAMTAIVVDSRRLNSPITVGKALAFRRDRIAGGLCLSFINDSATNSRLFRVTR